MIVLRFAQHRYVVLLHILFNCFVLEFIEEWTS